MQVSTHLNSCSSEKLLQRELLVKQIIHFHSYKCSRRRTYLIVVSDSLPLAAHPTVTDLYHSTFFCSEMKWTWSSGTGEVKNPCMPEGQFKSWYTSSLITCLTSTANLVLPCIAEPGWLHNWIWKHFIVGKATKIFS